MCYPLAGGKRSSNERRLILTLHAGMDMHKHFSMVTVVDDSGAKAAKGIRLENAVLEIVNFFKGLGDGVRG